MDAIVVNNLKRKFIKDFDKFRKRLHKGYRDDISLLLLEVSVIENSDYFSNLIYEHLMCHE